MKPSRIGFLLIILAGLIGCNNYALQAQNEKFQVIADDRPYPTEKYVRIGYTLKIWEYEKEGLSLQQIVIIDQDSRAELLKLEKADIPRIYRDPLAANPYFQQDRIFDYYLSLQLPIPLGQSIPKNVTHRFLFKDTVKNTDVAFEGGAFSPKTTMTPIAIASPVKGKNWLFFNQSTMGYHFHTLLFMNGTIGTGERFAFDNCQFNDDLTEYYHGDPASNESYYNYKDTLYAVADGTVAAARDGLPENAGNAHGVEFKSVEDLAGNFVIIDIGNGLYAFYAHCNTNSIKVKVGEQVKEGDPIALLGNSGNSDSPHLHFQICDKPDFLMSHGLPFVFKKFTRIVEAGSNTIPPPKDYLNAMMEQSTVISFD